MTTVDKIALSGTPDEIAAALEEQSRRMALHEYMAGTRLRVLAAELAKNTDFQVLVIMYGNESQELEVRLVSNPACDPIIVDRNNVGDRCQVSLDHWLNIESQPGVEETARLIAALLQVCADPKASTGGEWHGYLDQDTGWLTVDEVSRILRMSRQSIYRLRKQGYFPNVRVVGKRTIQISEGDVQAVMSADSVRVSESWRPSSAQ